MPRGRKPRSDRALTGAERQALYRARYPAGQAPGLSIRGDTARSASHPKPVARSSRPQRWRAAVAELVRLQAEYAAWLEAIPEALKASATAEALQAMLDIDLDELSALEPPRGFGRD
jgi:hypothetical protein